MAAQVQKAIDFEKEVAGNMNAAMSSQNTHQLRRQGSKFQTALKVPHKRMFAQPLSCMASSRPASYMVARWLAFSSTGQPPPSLTNVLLQVHVGKDRMDELSTVLLCSEKGLIRMARSFPPLLSMDPEDVFCRLLALKAQLPRCNVAGMVHGQPLLFLSRPSEEVVQQVSGNYNLFSRELPQMDVDTVVQERPAILFIENQLLLSGLPELRSMTSPYPADSTTCANLLWAIFGRSLEEKYNQIL